MKKNGSKKQIMQLLREKKNSEGVASRAGRTVVSSCLQHSFTIKETMELYGIAINPLAIGLSGVAAFLIGWVWYGMLFREPWVEAQRFTPEKKRELAASQSKMGMTMGISFLGYLVTAAALAIFLGLAHIIDLPQALQVSFIAWLGFSVMPNLMHTLYSGRSLVGLAIDEAYGLVYMLVSAFIITWLK